MPGPLSWAFGRAFAHAQPCRFSRTALPVRRGSPAFRGHLAHGTSGRPAKAHAADRLSFRAWSIFHCLPAAFQRLYRRVRHLCRPGQRRVGPGVEQQRAFALAWPVGLR